jgi:hypothetical protein
VLCCGGKNSSHVNNKKKQDTKLPLGHTNNPNGRPVGARNKRTKEIFEALEARGDIDPIDYLSSVIANGTDPSLKIQAAGILAPYKHSKQSPAPTPRYFEHPVTVPEFLTVEDAERFLASIPVLLGNQQLDSQSAMELSTLTRAWLSAKYERDEMKLKMAAANADPNPVITIRGGLPVMPGCEGVIMPQLNGHQVNDTTLPLGPPDNGPCDAPSDAPVIESIADASDPPPGTPEEVPDAT